MEIFLAFFIIITLVYLINFPVYNRLRKYLVRKDHLKSFSMLKAYNEYVKRYNLKVGIIENNIPMSLNVNEKSIKAVMLMDDLHYYTKLNTFHLSDEKITIIFGECCVILENEKSVTINIYEIHLRKKTNWEDYFKKNPYRIVSDQEWCEAIKYATKY